MRVSSIAEATDHVVLGGGESQAFGISDSPEFFRVLSDTLYSDKIQAVVREVLCNAWDAHIASGKTDVPVEVTLDDNELVIADKGPGIPPDKMRDIYCVYGSSTKTHDGDQTGGFGLGSKAPFAYSEHFTVVTAHEGLRSVYALSRASEENDGRPDLRQMAQMPTTYTGVTVSIPMVKEADRRDFSKWINLIAQRGGMNVTLNGETITVPSLAGLHEDGFAFAHPDGLRLLRNRPVVLYGNVMYSLPDASQMDAGLAKLVKRAMKLKPDDVWIPVLKAPPHSIGVTPSRESLSMSDMTETTLKRLLREFCETMEREVKKAQVEAFRELLRKHGEHDLDTAWRNTHVTAQRSVPLTETREQTVRSALSSEFAKTWDLHSFRQAVRSTFPARFRDTFSFDFYRGLRLRDFAFASRFVIRAAARAGELRNLRIMRPTYSERRYAESAVLARFKSTERFCGVFFLVDTNAQAEALARDWVKRRLGEGRDFAIPFARIPHNAPGRRAALKAELERYGIEVVQADKPEKKRKEEKLVFPALADANANTFTQLQPDLEDPKFYIDIAGIAANEVRNSRLLKMAGKIAHMYPDTALITYKKYHRPLKKTDAKPLVEEVEKAILEGVDETSLFVARALRDDGDCHYWIRHAKGFDFLGLLMKFAPDALKLFFPGREFHPQAMRQWSDLLKVHEAICRATGDLDRIEALDKKLTADVPEGLEVLCDEEAFRERYWFLGHLDCEPIARGYYHGNDRPGLLKVVEALVAANPEKPKEEEA